MELQDRVTVTLTEHGAKILNKCNKEFNDRYPKIKLFKTDYKGGDLFTSELYDIINSFNGHFNPGCYVCFTNIVPAEHPKDIPADKIKSDKMVIDSEKMIIRKFLEGFDCRIFNDVMVMGPVTIRATGKASRKEKDEFVSMTVYEMAINAFDAAMDEITRLRAKLARIQEVINEQ